MSAPEHLEAREVMRLFPHRYPFLLLDRVLELVPGQRSRAIKNVSVNEPQFTGHFPDEPLMPGVLILEAMAQCGGLVFEVGDRLCVLARVDNARFRKPVRPGDQLLLDGECLVARSSMGKVRARATVEGTVVAEAELTYSFVGGSTA